MKVQEIKDIQERIGAEPDGFWGPKSIAACQRHLRSLMPAINPWPNTDQQSLTQFFGKPGDASRLTDLYVKDLDIRYDGDVVKTIRCNAKVADSLRKVLESIASSEFNWVLDEYEGCYNNRSMRGGSLPSLHARGAAIDFCSDKNGNLTPWPVKATMPLEVMEFFAKEGWKAAGAFWGRDAMHFECTR